MSLAHRSDLDIPRPFLVFMGDIPDRGSAKTGFGLVDWRRDWCVGQWCLPGCGVDLGLPELGATQAAASGARTLVIGVAPDGGRIPAHWLPPLAQALDEGLHLAAGLHDALADQPLLAQRAQARGRRLFDARRPPAGLALPVASGQKRSGRRVLTVGTDCACGKKYTALALERELQARGIPATFRATGQTGVLISGGGIAIDAVVADFLAGVVEMMTPAAKADHWDVIEGQGSLFHPSYAGVSLGLLHGAQAEAFVLCHDPRRRHIDYLPDYPIPDLRECIDLHQRLGSLTSPRIRCAGISLNTEGMDPGARERLISDTEQKIGLPVCDPIATGVGCLVDHLLVDGPQ